MTEKQHKWYLREWGRAYRVHWAGVKNGECLSRPGRPHSSLRDQILGIAGRIAGSTQAGLLTPDCIRHACHVHALGKDKTSWSLGNRDLDLVVAVFRLLANSLDLKAQLALTRAEGEEGVADRKRMLYSLEKIDLPAAYLAEMARDKFGSSDWRGLPDAALRQLIMTAKARAAARIVAQSKKSSALAPSIS